MAFMIIFFITGSTTNVGGVHKMLGVLLKITVSRPYCMYNNEKCIYSSEENVTNQELY